MDGKGQKMSTINISSEEDSYTGISNNFIEYYMTDANGDFVKLYLYLAMLCASKREISLSDIADHLNCTENDVCRGIRYWIREDVLRLTYSNVDRTEVRGIVLLSLKKPNDILSSDLKLIDFKKAFSGGSKNEAQVKEPEEVVEEEAEEEPVQKAPRKKQPSPAELSSKLRDKEIHILISEATAYCNRELSQKELNSLIYIKDQLNFSMDLAEYLLEYCAEMKKTSFNYIEKVARNWYEEGITTREDAIEYSQKFLTLYSRILKALGITNRYTPAPVEKKYIDKWINTFCFSENIIIEACNRAIERRPNDVTFSYVNGILENWYNNNVKSFKDIAKLDDEHKSTKSRSNDSSRTNDTNKNTSVKKDKDKLKKLEEYYLQKAYDN